MLEVASTNAPEMVTKPTKAEPLEQILSAPTKSLGVSNPCRVPMISTKGSHLSILSRFAFFPTSADKCEAALCLSDGFCCLFTDATTSRAGVQDAHPFSGRQHRHDALWERNHVKDQCCSEEFFMLLLFLAELFLSLKGVKPNTCNMH